MGNLIVCTTCLVLGAAALPAQDLAWRIPQLGAVEYRRTWQAHASAVARTEAEARALPPTGKVPERYLPRLVPAPWLCQSELGADQKAIGDPVRDLRDVARALAFDVGSRGAIRGRFPRVLPFGDLALSGSWSSAAPDGAQSLRATLSSRLPAAATGEAKGVAERLRAFCVADAGGTLSMQRRIDAAKGVVAGFRAEFDLVVDEGEKQFRRFVLQDQWEFVAVRDNQDADFRKRVAAAIRAGTGFVREAIDERKSFVQAKGGDDRDYGGGRLALGLLTLLHGHVPKDDPVVARGFDDLRRRNLDDTYSLGTALMAMAARYATPGEAELLRSGNAAAIAPRALDERDRKAAQKWLQRMLQNVDPRGEAAQVLRFNYEAGPRYDTSLQQYGLLGLWSAQLCGLDVPDQAFAAAARHLLEVQGVRQGSLALQLTTYAELRLAAGTGALPRVPAQRAELRGFAYQDADEPAYGSMTSAGISGLLLARAGMSARGAVDRAAAQRIDDAVRDGFAWLAADFSVRANPGFEERADHHWYYWLYGLERSCELAGIALLHGRDWYYEGGLQLLAMQQANGSFRSEHQGSLLLDATCFAVLFLAKATAPAAVTGR